MKKRLTLEQLHVESVKLRSSLTDQQLDLIDFDEWLGRHGWSQFELEFHLKLRAGLIEAQRRIEDDDE